MFPHRGTLRTTSVGLRITASGSVAIAITVDDADQTVTVLGIFAGGQDYRQSSATSVIPQAPALPTHESARRKGVRAGRNPRLGEHSERGFGKDVHYICG